MKARNILGILALLLLFLLFGTAYWGYNLNTEKKGLMAENDRMEMELNDMEKLKIQLEVEVDSLQGAYELLADENETLQSTVEEEKAKARKSNQAVRNIKSTMAANQRAADTQMGDLRAQIQSLLGSKAQLESSINSLRMENDSLKNLTGVLTADLGKAREDNLGLANLNRAMEGELDKLTLSNFKASAFRVEVKKKFKSKVTSKSRKARKIDISFDLTNVPEKYQGVRPVYLVISDEKATPIKLKDPVSASIVVNGQETTIIAAEAKEVNITKNQRVTFSHSLDNKLSSGYYRIAIYTDIGVLGASSFKLR